jgi:RNA polymerase sigma-70 factor (TIGR02960 family)
MDRTMKGGDIASSLVLEEQSLLRAACAGDSSAFERLVAPYRAELHVHCYRMLGSVHDAEDALQDALLGAWRGLGGFEGRSSVRAWLYRITTNACLQLAKRRSRRMLPTDYGPAFDSVQELGTPISEPLWLEPYPDTLLASAARSSDPASRYDLRESVELAFVAALQYLPATQRAVLILREVLAFSAAQVAALLDTTVAAVNSALQRARKTLDQRSGGETQQATIRSLGEEGVRRVAEAYVAAWERADVPAIIDMLVDDARFTMPPLPAWFDGRDAIRRFLTERVFATRWRLVPMRASGQLAFACYRGSSEHPRFTLGALNVLTLRGERIVEMTGFLDPAIHHRFGLAKELLPRG